MTFALTAKSKTKPAASEKRAAKHKPVPNRSVVESLPRLGVLGVRFSVATPIIQPKLKIGAPNDKFEQEADRVADQVMRMPDSAVTGAAGLNEAGQSSHQSPGATPPFLQRQCSKCATEDETRLQRSPLPSAVKHPKISALNGSLTAQFQRLNLLGSESQPVAISEQIALPQIQRLCSECEEQLQRQPVEEEELLQAKEMPNGTPQVSSNLSNQIDSMRGGGQPLPKSVRAFVEPRLGQDFSHVRIHTGSKAAESAEALNARAYTVGQQIVFGKGQYVPETAAGKRLLAHELVHITQQNQTIHNSQIQRTCNPGPIAATVGTRSGCTDRFDGTFVSGPLFKFNSECDTFQPGVDLVLRGFALTLPPTTTFEIHGFASTDGPVDFNQNLGCARALAAQKLLTDPPALGGAGIAPSRITGVINHGPVSGPIADRRSVVIQPSVPVTPTPPVITNRCGPDSTSWFIRQVAAAKVDPTILALQTRLAGAERVARRFGFSAERIAEGGVAKKVLAEEVRVGSPTRTTEASGQIAASVPGQREFGRAIVAAPVPLVGAPEAIVLAAVRGAALTWKGLVGTGMKYDFKNRPETLQNPTSDNCPDNCANTITLCSATGSDCFVKDVPGNLFYAHVGKFVGWTELTLQLGSQFAQLESSATWDPPEDTRMITFGFGLPSPLTQTDLCSEINANRSIFDLQNCSNCEEELTIDPV